jgi:hypothetical protein
MSTTDISAADATVDVAVDATVGTSAPIVAVKPVLSQRLTTAYLRTALGVDASSFATASAAAARSAGSIGRLDSK